MTTCPKCRKSLSVAGAVFCPFCGVSLDVQAQPKPRPTHKRGNGQGTAFRRGKTWTARVTVDIQLSAQGTVKQVRRTKGGFPTKSAALAACPELARSIPQKKPSITLNNLYEEWKASYHTRIKKTTMAGYDAAFAYYEPIRYACFVDLRVSDWQACIDACPNGKRTKQNMKNISSLLYQYAMRSELVTTNKAATLYCGNDQQKTREAFTPEELEQIRLSDDPYAPYVYCLCYLGFRPGEMLALKKTAYDPERKTLIGGGKTKAGTNRVVPVSPKIQSVIDARMASGSDYLFPRLTDGKAMTHEYFRKFCFDPLMKSLGITGMVPYCCRHTFANLLKNVAGSDTDKAALMGHSDISMTRYYQSDDLASLQSIVNNL